MKPKIKVAWISAGVSSFIATYLATLMILLDIGAAAVNLQQNNHKMAVYWIAAAVLNAAVTF